MNVKGLLTMIVMLLFSLVSCSCEESATVGSGDTISGDAGKILIVYFSWGGNTRMVANHIHDLVGCDIVEVETVIPYPDSYEEVIQIAPGEDEYDTLIVGTPIWGGHLTPAMKSFLAGYDLSGKYIAPFCTHGGSGTAQSVSDIRSVCPNSTLLGSLAVYGNRAENSRGDVEKWLKQIGIIE